MLLNPGITVLQVRWFIPVVIMLMPKINLLYLISFIEDGFIERSMFTSHWDDDNKDDTYDLQPDGQDKSLEVFKLYTGPKTKSSTIVSQSRNKQQFDNNDDDNNIIQSKSLTSSFMRNGHSESISDNCCKCTQVIDESNAEDIFFNYFEKLDEQIERFEYRLYFNQFLML